MKRLIKVLAVFAASIGAAILILAAYSNYLDSEIKCLYTEKENTLSQINGVPAKDKGNAWIKESAESNDLFILGSSELSSPVPQNIAYDFPNSNYAGNISAIGHAYVQNALHAMDLGANYSSFKKSNIVVIESIQWFFGNDISTDGFMSNFSELQFYEFLHNGKISEANKEYLCSRFLEIEKNRTKMKTPQEINQVTTKNKILTAFGITMKFADHGWLKMFDTDYDYPQTHLLATLYLSDNFAGKTLYELMRSYYFIRFKLLSLKDKYETYQYLKSVKQSGKKNLFVTDWDQQFKKAEQDGETACTNNDIYVYDKYFTTYLAGSWSKANNSSAGTTALVSAEWDDYRFLLSVCNQLELKPYIIDVSINGYYYDYTGVNPAMRQKYYLKKAETANEYNIPIYSDLKDKEYEPYVFADVMHLGWKGWIYVTKAITEHFQSS